MGWKGVAFNSVLFCLLVYMYLANRGREEDKSYFSYPSVILELRVVFSTYILFL